MQRVKQAALREGNAFKEYTRQHAQQREDDIRLLKVGEVARPARVPANGVIDGPVCIPLRCAPQEQYAEVQSMYEARVRALETKLTKARQRYVATLSLPPSLSLTHAHTHRHGQPASQPTITLPAYHSHAHTHVRTHAGARV